jgi:hypothetical protein
MASVKFRPPWPSRYSRAQAKVWPNLMAGFSASRRQVGPRGAGLAIRLTRYASVDALGEGEFNAAVLEKKMERREAQSGADCRTREDIAEEMHSKNDARRRDASGYEEKRVLQLRIEHSHADGDRERRN